MTVTNQRIESRKVIPLPSLWLTRYDLLVDGGACGFASLADLSKSPLIFVGGLTTVWVRSALDGYDFVRLPAQWIGTTLRDSTTALNVLMQYRRLASTIDNHIFNVLMNDYQIKVNMPAYYQKVLEYCNARLRGEEKQKVENYVTAAGYLGPTNDFCEELYIRLLDNQELKVLLDKLEAIHQQCVEVRDSILALPGFRFEN